MKTQYAKLASIVLIVWFFLLSCNSNERKPLTSIDEAKTYIAENFKDSTETLWISDELTEPNGMAITGMNMAIIGDKILGLGYMPDGFEQKDGYRIYRYKKQ